MKSTGIWDKLSQLLVPCSGFNSSDVIDWTGNLNAAVSGSVIHTTSGVYSDGGYIRLGDTYPNQGITTNDAFFWMLY